MTPPAPEWTVLVTVAQAEAQDAVSEEQQRRILEALGREDAWIQYPPASGRGHGFESRWWQAGEDAVSVAIEAIERYREAVAAVRLDVDIVLVHVASPEDRLNESVIGLDRRAASAHEAGDWNVMIRAIAEAGRDDGVDRDALARLLARLPGGESSGFSRGGLVEVRFWAGGEDAVDAADRGSRAFSAAVAAVGHSDWSIVRVHVTSLAEAARTAYHGVERRVRAHDRATASIVIHPATTSPEYP